MLWTKFSVGELQAALMKTDPTLLDNLEEMLPVIKGDKYDPTELTLKKNMALIFDSFSSSECFTDKSFMRHCLNRLSPSELLSLSRFIGVGVEATDFKERVEAIVRKGWKDRNYAKRFIEYFNLSNHFLPPENINLPSTEKINMPTIENPILLTHAYKPLKDYQFIVYNEANEKIAIPCSRFVIQMPTGSGKTRTSMQFICNHINDSENNPIVFWIAHSQELCEQAFQCFTEVWTHLAKKNLTVARFWGEHELARITDEAMFVVGGFQKINSYLEKNKGAFSGIRDRVSLIIVDEAHKTTAPTYAKAVRSLMGDSTCVVGLTATPGRAIIEETEDLIKFYFSRLVPEEPLDIKELMSRRILSVPSYEPIIMSGTYKLDQKEKEKLARLLDFPAWILESLGASTLRNIEIIRRLVKECDSGKRILFFSCSVKHSKFITALMLYLRYNAAHVDGGTSKGRRRQIIEDFKKGKVQLLCNYGVLSTGFDAPNTDVVFISRPTKSVVLYSQMIGRGLRGPAIGGTEKCKIIDVLDHIEGFGDQEEVYNHFKEFWK